MTYSNVMCIVEQEDVLQIPLPQTKDSQMDANQGHSLAVNPHSQTPSNLAEAIDLPHEKPEAPRVLTKAMMLQAEIDHAPPLGGPTARQLRETDPGQYLRD